MYIKCLEKWVRVRSLIFPHSCCQIRPLVPHPLNHLLSTMTSFHYFCGTWRNGLLLRYLFQRSYPSRLSSPGSEALISTIVEKVLVVSPSHATLTLHHSSNVQSGLWAWSGENQWASFTANFATRRTIKPRWRFWLPLSLSTQTSSLFTAWLNS